MPQSCLYRSRGKHLGSRTTLEVMTRCGCASEGYVIVRNHHRATTRLGPGLSSNRFSFQESFGFRNQLRRANSIVVGKTYSTEDQEGLRLWERVIETSQAALRPFAGVAEPQRRFGEPTLIVPRLGQGAFRVSVTDAYGRTCAISGGKVLPALDAAHIKPYSFGGTHEVSNGILLRRDIHSVFDAGYVTFDEDLRFVVSDRVRSDFNNGEEYRRLHGQRLNLPAMSIHQPQQEVLRWHNQNKFLG